MTVEPEEHLWEEDDLLRPDAYPPPPPTTILVERTHASRVFLTDHDVWKLKRPVNLGFLDYSTAERRRGCCEEEVRQGMRLAPDIYLGVVPLRRGADGRATFTGQGAPIDHAVHMRRLNVGDSALALLRAGRLEPESLRRLAARLAAFYAAAPETPAHGAPAILARQIAENYQQSVPYVGRFVAQVPLDKLRLWQEGALAAAQTTLLERVSEGRIRDGHGDLRLEHVYFPSDGGGAPLVIDPIEFNDDFRCQDVALDVAFLAMELEAWDRRDLAVFFISCFAEASGDYGFYPLLDLYLSYRAWVRAKVACLVAVDPECPPDKRRRKGAEAEQLFALASALSSRTSTPGPVIVVAGLVGAGKSFAAQALGLALSLPVISTDATRKSMAGLPLREPGPASLYTDEGTSRTYAEVLRRAGQLLTAGRPMILDGTFRDPKARGAARALAEAYARPFRFIEVTCDPKVARARLRARVAGTSMSDADESVYDLIAATWVPPGELPERERCTVSGTGDVSESIAAIKQWL